MYNAVLEAACCMHDHAGSALVSTHSMSVHLTDIPAPAQAHGPPNSLIAFGSVASRSTRTYSNHWYNGARLTTSPKLSPLQAPAPGARGINNIQAQQGCCALHHLMPDVRGVTAAPIAACTWAARCAACSARCSPPCSGSSASRSCTRWRACLPCQQRCPPGRPSAPATALAC
jgi:hypothetical protein